MKELTYSNIYQTSAFFSKYIEKYNINSKVKNSKTILLLYPPIKMIKSLEKPHLGPLIIYHYGLMNYISFLCKIINNHSTMPIIDPIQDP